MNTQMLKVLNHFVIFAKKTISIRLYMHQAAQYMLILTDGKFCETRLLLLIPKSKYGKSKLTNEIYASELIKSLIYLWLA